MPLTLDAKVTQEFDSSRSSDSQPPNTLAAALARHGIELEEEQVALLDRFATALWSWNEKLNLTRHTDYEKFVTRDVVDSQWLERFLDSAERVLDVGTGGGVPGVILAILRPDLEVSLCESIAKKARAVEDIVQQVGLPIEVQHARAEELLVNHEYDTLVVRAVAPLEKLLAWFKPHWGSFHRLLVIKGPAWVQERAAAQEKKLLRGVRINVLATYPLPGTESESVVLEVRSSADRL
ncbi:MAG: 16S rRNA (guanine(527)-N(7))-methyltransferase RsmG [Pirellulales bacterium]